MTEGVVVGLEAIEVVEGQGDGIALWHEVAGRAVLDRGLQPAHARGHDGAAAGHGLERHHPERLVRRRHDRGVGRGVEEPEPPLRLGAQEVHTILEPERPDARAQAAGMSPRRASSRHRRRLGLVGYHPSMLDAFEVYG